MVSLVALLMVGVLIAYGLRTHLRDVFGEPDPACLSQSGSDLKQLISSVAKRLSAERVGPIDAYSGCEPPEEGPWIAVRLAGSSIDRILEPFRSTGWSSLPQTAIREVADPGETGSAITGVVGGRAVNLYALTNERADGMVKVIAWFAD